MFWRNCRPTKNSYWSIYFQSNKSNLSCSASDFGTHELPHWIKNAHWGKKHRASHSVWNVLIRHSECGGYIRFNEGKHQCGFLGVKVNVNYVDRERIKVSVVDYWNSCIGRTVSSTRTHYNNTAVITIRTDLKLGDPSQKQFQH